MRAFKEIIEEAFNRNDALFSLEQEVIQKVFQDAQIIACDELIHDFRKYMEDEFMNDFSPMRSNKQK